MNNNNNEQELPQLRRKILRLGKSLTEELAGYLIACQLGNSFLSEHIGQANESADCQITQNGDLHGLVEVTTHSNPQHEALFNKVLTADGSERLILPQGMGAWTCEMTLETRFDDLTVTNVCDLLTQLQKLGLEDIDVDYSWTNGPEIDLVRNLGLRSIRRVEIPGDFIFRHMPLVGGVIDDALDLLADYAEGFVNNLGIADKLERLSRRADGLHRHFCIVIGSASGLSHKWRMNGISLVPPIPQRPITLPKTVDSLWVMSNESGRILGFNSKTGWSEFQRPSRYSPWWKELDLTRVKEINTLTENYYQLVARN